MEGAGAPARARRRGRRKGLPLCQPGGVFDLIILVVSIGVVDSLNPSTVGPALYLATAESAQRRVAGYTLGVFGVYLLGGVLVALGPGQLLFAVLPRPSDSAKHVLELGLGAGALGLAAGLWFGRDRVQRTIRGGDQRNAGASVALGAGISAIELPTAFPYFAAIAAIVGSGAALPAQIGLLFLFNAAFVAPLLIILVIRSWAGRRAERILLSWRGWFQRRAAVILAAIVLAAGVALIAIGAVGLATG